jgi:hypothetical protein
MKSFPSTFLACIGGLCIALASGCHLYFGDDDDDCTPRAQQSGRNPYTGQCEYWGGGEECWEDYGPVDRETGVPAPPDWAACVNYCTGLDEYNCMATSGCRAVQMSSCPEGWDCMETTYTYFECWGTAPSGPISGVPCSGLEAHECSRHDDCIARHYPGQYYANAGAEEDRAMPEPPAIGNFESCQQEPATCFSNADCDPGFRCNADEICLDACGDGTGTGIAEEPCDMACMGFCVPDDSPPPPPPPPPPACSELTDEAACIEREDCNAYYQGIDCTCDESGCTCADWVFTSCG